mgnify:FL=1
MLMCWLSTGCAPRALWPEDVVGREGAGEVVLVRDVAGAHGLQVLGFELAVDDAAALRLDVAGKVDEGEL